VFSLAAWAKENVDTALIWLAAWFVFNATIAFTPATLAGIDTVAQIPVLRIGFGLIGAIAVVTIASLLSRIDAARFLRYAGRNSIVLYVSFVLPMAATRVFLLKTGLVSSVGFISLIVMAVAAAVPLTVHALIRNTKVRFLFERPESLKIERRKSKVASSAAGRPLRSGRPFHAMTVPAAGRR
jgi:uncharacterized membrane protein YcfT